MTDKSGMFAVSSSHMGLGPSTDDKEKYSPDAGEDDMMTPTKLVENWLASHRRLGSKLHQRKRTEIKELVLVMQWMAVSCGQHRCTKDVQRF